MAISPGLQPDDNSTAPGSKVAGTGGRGYSGIDAGDTDPTAEPGQYPGDPSWANQLFGGPLPTGTGAPGTQGARYDSGGDPTNEPGQLHEGLTGLGPADIADSGAPGTATTPNTEGGSATITFTDPATQPGVGAYRSETVHDDISGPRGSTNANDQGYATGGPQLPGIAGNEPQAGSGRYQPGAGGSVRRGGRAVRG
jgi:hypothetical protein